MQSCLSHLIIILDPAISAVSFAPGNEAAAVPKATPTPKEDPPTAAGDKDELTKDEILQKNREEFFRKRMKGSEKST